MTLHLLAVYLLINALAVVLLERASAGRRG